MGDLLDKLLNPEKYRKLAQGESKRYWEQDKIDQENREKNCKAARPYAKRAEGVVDGKEITLYLHWMQPYPEHGWWSVSYNGDGREEYEWYGHGCFSSDFKHAGYKRAVKEFNKIVKEFGLKVIENERKIGKV